jgi:hypothetical protein
MRWLEEHGHGYRVPYGLVPIVPAAVLFDLPVGDWRIRPDAQAGYSACVSASRERPAEGNVGAGAGALVGKLFGIGRAMKGGIGSASITLEGVTVGAIVAVNALGDVVDPATGATVAGARTEDGRALLHIRDAILAGDALLALHGASGLGLGPVPVAVGFGPANVSGWVSGSPATDLPLPLVFPGPPRLGAVLLRGRTPRSTYVASVVAVGATGWCCHRACTDHGQADGHAARHVASHAGTGPGAADGGRQIPESQT